MNGKWEWQGDGNTAKACSRFGHEQGNLQPATCNLQPATCNPQLATHNSERRLGLFVGCGLSME
jgi:hypothetical protein